MAATKAARIRELEAALDGSERDIRLLQTLLEILQLTDVDQLIPEVERLQKQRLLQDFSIQDLRKILKVVEGKRAQCSGLDPLRCDDPHCPIHGKQAGHK